MRFLSLGGCSRTAKVADVYSRVISMDESITRLVHQWQQGDTQAATDLDRRVRADLLALVRSRRDIQLRARIDSEGIVNAALRSFLSGVAKGEFSQIANHQDIRRVLAHCAICILKDQVRAEHAAKRDARRDARGLESQVDQVADSGRPTPQECVEAIEFWEKFPEVVRHVHENSIDILERSLEGLSPSQIAEELGMGIRTVQLVIRRMIDTWNDWLIREEGDDAPRSRKQ